MDGDRRELHIEEHLVQVFCPVDLASKDDTLIVGYLVEQGEEHLVFLLLNELGVELFKTMKGQPFLIIDVNDMVDLIMLHLS